MRYPTEGFIWTEFDCPVCDSSSFVSGVKIGQDANCEHCGSAVFITPQDLGE